VAAAPRAPDDGAAGLEQPPLHLGVDPVEIVVEFEGGIPVAIDGERLEARVLS
jgi:argininosuccinate synthase